MMGSKLMNMLRQIFTTNGDLQDAARGAQKLEEAERQVKETLGLLQVRKENIMRAPIVGKQPQQRESRRANR